ncbi:MAG: alpha/beta fold hydrolase [Opitutales bacterium]|nr:alpha/beta fold hydrolase [Opitutales bacterium]
MKGSKVLESTVSLAYLDSPSVDPNAPVLVLLHGSPVASSSLQNISEALEGPYRVIVPDLPGFGGSTLEIEDYSILAHAYYLDQLMVQLEVDSFHLIGYSMGGGVAIDYVHAFPEKVKSLQLVSSIGVQELELLGDYLINHTIHGAQLAGLWLLQECVPHFGWMDNAILNVSYARNFFDSDQRPFRAYLEEVEVPKLILHA